jgi:outer membrane immunogenic protein
MKLQWLYHAALGPGFRRDDSIILGRGTHRNAHPPGRAGVYARLSSSVYQQWRGFYFGRTILVKKFMLVGALALSISASAAIAADYDMPPAYSWSGAYLGIQGGYGFGETEWAAGAAVSTPGDFNGMLGGLTAGTNTQFDNYVYGLEGDLSLSGIAGSSTDSATFVCGGVTCDTDLEWLGTVRLRMGYAMGSTLPYITGGLAAGGANASATGLGTLGDDMLLGWTAGGGLEQGFSDSLSVKIEYLYTDLGDLDIGAPCVGGCVSPVNFGAVRVGLNWQF